MLVGGWVREGLMVVAGVPDDRVYVFGLRGLYDFEGVCPEYL